MNASVAFAWAPAALLLAACSSARDLGPVVSVEETRTPAWYAGLQFQLRDPAGGPGLLLWPHEGVAVEAFQPVTREHVHALARTGDGFGWEVRGLDAPEVTVRVRLVREADGVALRYDVRNEASGSRVVTVAPCLQLGDGFFAGVSDAARAEHVWVPTAERGWQAIARTRRVAGVADPVQGIEPRPWTQHYVALRGHRHAAMPHDAVPGLNVFGVSEEHVSAGVIVALRPDGARAVAVATDREIGVAFALLNCLHAVVQVEVPPHGVATARYRVWLADAPLPALVERVRRELALPDLPLPAAPDARAPRT
jgi:hypothetical protein